MWLLERLYPDYKSIAEFRRMYREGVTAAGAELVRFAKSCGLIRGEWIAIDGSKFRAVASIDTARERFQLQRYLDSREKLDNEESPEFDNAGLQAALEKLRHHPEAQGLNRNRCHLEPYGRFLPDLRVEAERPSLYGADRSRRDDTAHGSPFLRAIYFFAVAAGV